jgi:hypothetical protein
MASQRPLSAQKMLVVHAHGEAHLQNWSIVARSASSEMTVSGVQSSVGPMCMMGISRTREKKSHWLRDAMAISQRSDSARRGMQRHSFHVPFVACSCVYLHFRASRNFEHGLLLRPIVLSVCSCVSLFLRCPTNVCRHDYPRFRLLDDACGARARTPRSFFV